MSGPAPPAGGALNVASAQPAAAANSASSTFKLSKKLGSSLSRFRRDKSMGDTSRADKLRKDIDFTEHTWPADKLYEYYGATPEGGLTSAQVLQNRAKWGRNCITPPPSTPWWIAYLKCYADVFMMLLLFGGVLCFVAYGIDQSDPTNLYLGVVLILVVVLSATFGYYQEAKAAGVMSGFAKLVPKKCKALRDGTIVILDAEELVPGDVVDLSDGDQVPADIRILSCNDMQVDNSSLTGESEPQERYPDLARDSNGKLITVPLEATNLCFFTTIITAGSGRGMVIGTGDRTVMGQIAGLASESGNNDKTQFQQEVDVFIKIISVVAIIIGVTFVLIGIFVAKASPIEMIVFAIGIIVGTVPEGLLVTLTVSLALSAKNMYAKNVLVKGMPSVENLGSTTVVASDKTGTLTQNRMTVQHAWYNGALVTIPAARNRPQLVAAMRPGALKGPLYNPQDPTWQKLQMVATLCNNSRFVIKDNDDESAPPIDLVTALEDPDFNLLGLTCTGDASESGLIKCTELLRSVEEYHAACPKLHEIKFNSTNKWQLSVHKPEDPAAQHPVIVLKGAPERVLRMCTHIMIDGEAVPMDAEMQKKYNDAYESLGAMGERVLGFAYREMSELPMDYEFTNKPEPNFVHDNLVFVGLMSLIDPPREGVREAVEKCKRARIKVYMVTGDHPITAQAIAKQIGIIDDEKYAAGKAIVIKGDDIRDWMDIEDPVARQAKWDWALDHEQIVFARVSPAHKLLIVENCQRRGENVAVTGDGVNDAPALKKANTGLAMGISGKDVSKEAADMILMDDNFASIVNGIEEGRVIFDNLKKSIAYTLASKFPEQIPFLLYVIAQFPLALSTILILTIDLGCDMMPAISLAYEPKEADIMDRPPRNPKVERLVSRRLISFSYFQVGIMQTCAGFLAFMAVLNDYGYAWSTLPGLGINWSNYPMICTAGPTKYGIQSTRCGFGCEAPQESWNGVTTLYGQYAARGDSFKFCQDGCAAPFNGTADPFVEFSEFGFRGFAPSGPQLSDPVQAVCGRTCGWFAGLSADTRAFFVRQNDIFRARLGAGLVDPSDPFNYSPDAAYALLLSAGEAAQFEQYCAAPGADAYGFPGRGLTSDDVDKAPQGGWWWWNGLPQYWPNLDNQKNVLQMAQSAYFLAVVVARWADLLVCKTRQESIFNQGMRNKVLNWSLLFETFVASMVVYLPPLNTVFNTRPVPVIYICAGLPMFIFIFLYDELRKLRMRQNPRGWVKQNTAY
ncbi:sodium potassium-transporting ATPase subunit alpha-1 [Micractinium conductrix]|uniref:Sodium potassium-transporting ATPase subunit alpha-1 n=1 Tax=Micractinium conductrix TaxID=554055 RepID=A0A2P6V9J6_9CHLO|nr:sodium potassium-transporting ATPase subunit alpha-1 [Micractinium conductrix]|eukprot:PSC70763.1 sodium potassium-transporting ATPase subunit alpha-1 [Micractinium conductrix]